MAVLSKTWIKKSDSFEIISSMRILTLFQVSFILIKIKEMYVKKKKENEYGFLLQRTVQNFQ